MKIGDIVRFNGKGRVYHMLPSRWEGSVGIVVYAYERGTTIDIHWVSGTKYRPVGSETNEWGYELEKVNEAR